MKKSEFKTLAQKPILLDGATGSNLMAAGMPKNSCAEQWILEHPQVLIDLQQAYVTAGSQIVYAPTFGGNRINLTRHGLRDRLEEINTSLVELSRKAVDGHAYIAGDITTTGEMLEPLGDMTYEEAHEIYVEQISVLAKANVDLLVIETMISMDETIAALDAAKSVCDLPVMCTLTVDATGKLFFGGDIIEDAASLVDMGADAIGINCSLGPAQAVSIIENLRKKVDCPIIAKPNAGMPEISPEGIAVYSMEPGEFTIHMLDLMNAGASIVGGCCGTTPAFIEMMAGLIESQS